MNRTPFTLTLQAAETIAPQTKHFTFLVPQTISFVPGQFITLHLPGHDKMLRRSYSLANRQNENTHLLELAATYIPGGVASEKLFNMQPGETIEATGPFGRLILRDEPVTQYLLIATGTGITPYRAMLRELAHRMNTHPDLSIKLLFGVRHSQDVLYREEWVKFAQENSRFDFRVCYSREPTTTLPYECSGYVTTVLKDLLTDMPSETVAYLCGNPNMVDDAYHLLSGVGLTNDKIRREKYISSK